MNFLAVCVPLSLDTRFKILPECASVFGFASAKNAFAQLVRRSAQKGIRIRFAQLRGFASLNLLRLGQTARRQTLRHLPYAKNKKQPAKNAGASLRFAPSGVFCFLLRASGFGFGSGRFARSALFGCPVSALRGCLCGSSFWRFLWLLWLAFAVLARCRRRFRRLLRRAFRRLRRLVAAWRLAALPVLIASRFRRRVGRARRFLSLRLRRLVLVARRLRGVRRLWFRRFLRRARAAVWSLSFLRRVRPRLCRRRLRPLALLASVRVLGLRWLLPLGAAFRLSFFLAFRLVFLRRRFCRLGWVLGLSLVRVFGRSLFVLFLPLLTRFRFNGVRVCFCLTVAFCYLFSTT